MPREVEQSFPGFHIKLTPDEWNQLDSVSHMAHLGKGAYITQLIRRDLYDAHVDRCKQNEVPLPGKTPAEYEAEKKRLEWIVQNQRRIIEEQKKEIKKLKGI